jgi:hypothetical protein
MKGALIQGSSDIHLHNIEGPRIKYICVGGVYEVLDHMLSGGIWLHL